MSDGAACAHGNGGQPECGAVRPLPGPGQGHAGQAQGQQAGVDLRGQRALLARHAAAQDLIGGVGQQLQRRPDQGPAAELAAARPQDDQRARKAQRHQHPAQGADLLAQPERGQQGQGQRRQRHDGRELRQRQIAQAEHGQRIAQAKQNGAQTLKARALGAKNLQPMSCHAKAHGQHRLQRIAQPQRHQQRQHGARIFGARIEYRKTGAGQHREADARQRMAMDRRGAVL